MKVKELIKKLQQIENQDLDIFINWDAQGPSEIRSIGFKDCPKDYPSEYNMPDEWIEIT